MNKAIGIFLAIAVLAEVAKLNYPLGMYTVLTTVAAVGTAAFAAFVWSSLKARKAIAK